MKVNYHVLNDSVVVNFNGTTVNIAKGDVRFDPVIRAIKTNKLSDIPAMVDINHAYSKKGLELKDNRLWLDGEQLPESLSDRILTFQKDGLPFEYLIKFARKLRLNPSFNSRLQLYKFLEHNGHPITTEGNFIAYRGIRDDFTDVHTGTFDNSVGSICEIPRSEVDDNPNNTCSKGLHVACYDYAHGFGRVTVEVEVDPIDVVAVPTDYNGTKMRVCKFKVVSTCDSMNTKPLVKSSYEKQSALDIDCCDDFTCDGDCDETDDYCDDDYTFDCNSEGCDESNDNPIEGDDIVVLAFRNSSTISGAAYNPTTKVLEVTFKSGSIYEYHNVPATVISDWLDTDSVGRFFTRKIKDKYSCTFVV